MTDREAWLQCRCGACRITLCDPTVRYHTECFCFDCRQRGLVSASRDPGNSLPDAVAKFERGVDLLYFTNAFQVDEASRELLEFSKLTPDGFNTTAMSACCGTLMCGTHPVYEGTTISVNADSCRVTTPSSMPVQAILFACDLTDEQARSSVRRSSVPVVFSVYEEIDTPVIKALVNAVTAPVPARIRAVATTNFESLCAAKPLAIDNSCYAESRAGKP